MRYMSHDRSHLAPLDHPSSGRASRVHLPPQGGKGLPSMQRNVGHGALGRVGRRIDGTGEVRLEVPHHVLRACDPDSVERRRRERGRQQGRAPERRYPRRHDRLDLYRPRSPPTWSSASRPTANSGSPTTSTASGDMESTTMQGVTIKRVYFQPDVNIDLAIAQVVASTNSIRAVMPPGIQPPVVMRFTASSVPVIQLALTSDTGEPAADLRLRPLSHSPDADAGARLDAAARPTAASRGRSWSISTCIRSQAYGLTPLDVTNAMTAQNLDRAFGPGQDRQHPIPDRLNSSPDAIEASTKSRSR